MTDQPRYPSYPGPEQPEMPPPALPPSAPAPGHGPPSGYQPPPPYGQPPAYGQAPPPGYLPPGHGQAPAGTYAGWWSRVGAALLDGLILLAVVIIPFVVGLVITFKDAETDPVTGDITGGIAASGVVIVVLTLFLTLAFDIWNRGIRVGSKGHSLGKRIVGIRVVRADDGQLLGSGGGFLRWLMAFVFGLISCLSVLDLLWPLWDDRNQTLHDKVVSSKAVRA